MAKIFTGSISFGLVTVNITLYPATDDKSFGFNQLCKNGHRIKHKKVCEVEDREVDLRELQKGYAVSKDVYIVISDSDLMNLKSENTHTIDIKQFCDKSELNPIHIEKSYYIAPDLKRSNDKAYQLFLKVLTDTKKIAIGTFILRDKECIVAVRAYGKSLVLHTLKYVDEIRPNDEISEIVQTTKNKTKLDPEEVSLAKLLVEKFTVKKLDLSEFKDDYRVQLEKLIEAKSKGKTIEYKPKEEIKPAPELLDALKASIKGNWSGRKK